MPYFLAPRAQTARRSPRGELVGMVKYAARGATFPFANPLSRRGRALRSFLCSLCEPFLARKSADFCPLSHDPKLMICGVFFTSPEVGQLI